MEKVGNRAHAYRIGGDEFCVLGSGSDELADTVSSLGRAALSESGYGFHVTTSCGSVPLPVEGGDSASALREANLRLYAEKNARRASPARQACDALLTLLAERSPLLADRIGGVADLAGRVAEVLVINPSERQDIHLAARLHDIGKAAIPDRILSKTGALNEDEWVFLRQHTIIGERIVAAAPALRGVAG
ncbi:MAG: HD domain-containing protein [Actinomycetota bacterium]|nr:HD domain-containing protein [Actinomycetota bacterium]